MKRFVLALGLLLVLIASAVAQGIGLPFYPLQSVPPKTVIGNPSVNAGPTQAIPFSQFQSYFFAGETPVSDANYSMVSTDRTIVYTAITAARTITLLPAATFAPGQQFTILDRSGNPTTTNTISIAPTGADTIDGANSSDVLINAGYGGAVLETDGVSKWTTVSPSQALIATIPNAAVIGYSTSSKSFTALSSGANTWYGNETGSTAAPTSNSWTNCNGNNSAVNYTNGTGTGCNANLANLTVADQTVSGGANVTTAGLTTGNITIDCGKVPIQSITNGGAFTITAPTNDGSCILVVTNNASASTITFSGFSVGSNTGDALTTTNGNKFSIFIWRGNSIAGYRIAAHQ